MGNQFFKEKTKTITLPETGINVVIRSLTFGEALEFADIQTLEKGAQFEAMNKFVLSMMVSWGAKHHETGQDIPMSAEAVKSLPIQDGNFLFEQSNSFTMMPEDEETVKKD